MRNITMHTDYHFLNRTPVRATAVTVVAGLLALVMLLSSPQGVAKQNEDRKEHWSDWQALSEGYVGRRKVPANADKPLVERRLENVKERLSNLQRLRNRLEEDEKQAGERAKSGGSFQLRGRRDEYKGGQSSYSGSRSNYDGARSDYGEYRSGNASARSALEQRIRELKQEKKKGNDMGSVGRGNGGAAARPDAVWLYTGGEGLYVSQIDTLAEELGVNANRLRAQARNGHLGLSNAGVPVGWYFDGEADSVVFAAQAYDTFHAEENAYRLTMENGRGTGAMEVVRGGAVPAGTQMPFRETLHFEEEPDFQYVLWAVSDEPDADYWFWDYLWGGHRDLVEVDLYIPAPAPTGGAQLRVTMRGWTDLEPGDEHQVYAELNGVQVGSVVTWDGFDEAVLVADFDQSVLDPSGDNVLGLRNIYADGTHPGQYLDQVEIDYLRNPVASAGTLWLNEVDAGPLTVTGFPDDDIVVIESPAGDSMLREDVRIEADSAGGYQVTFEAAGGADYLVAARGTTATPRVELDRAADLASRNNSGDYLIIAPRAFENTAEALSQHRQGRFGSVRIVWLDQIYSEFSHGRVDPFALARFMERARQWRTPPSHVVLVGKGSLDHKDRMGYSDSFIPVVMSDNPWSLAASDHRLLNGEGGADAGYAIGRLPITSDEEGLAYVDKLVDYESVIAGAGRYDAVLAADNPDSGGEFHANSDVLADRLTGSLGFEAITKLYHPRDAVRQNLILSDTWETGYVTYQGHGSATQIGDGRENFLKAADADALVNSTRPFFAALTCAVADYTMPGSSSLAGALVLNHNGGAIASLAPTGLSLDSEARILNEAFVDSLFGSNMTVGEAIRQAKGQTSGSISGYMPRLYGIIGDPAVYVR